MEQCIDQYNNLLENFKIILKKNIIENSSTDSYNISKELIETNITNCVQKSNDEKYNNIKNFYNSLDQDDLFLLFSKMKIKIFSAKTIETHNISCSLFNEDLSLKHLFNNQPDLIKNQAWEQLFRLYISYLKQIDSDSIQMKERHNSRLTTLLESIKIISNDLSSKVKQNLLKVDTNKVTNNMIDDIVGSFQDIMSNKANPFDNIMNITNMISTKYKSQLENGDVQLDKIMGGIEGVIPGLMKQGNTVAPEPVIINETFSTADVDVGKEEEGGGSIASMMKMLPGMGGIMNMVQRLNTAQSEDELTDIKKDMDSFLEKELKVDMTQFKNNMSNIENQFHDLNVTNNNIEPVD